MKRKVLILLLLISSITPNLLSQKILTLKECYDNALSSNALAGEKEAYSAISLIRDQNLRRIRQVGRKTWKKETNYHRRSLAETMMFRLKSIFSDQVSARSFEGQAAQILIRCAILNRMTELGRPESYRA